MRVGGRVDRDDVGRARGERRVGLERAPRGQREAADAVAQRRGAVPRVRRDREHGLPCGDEVAEQAGDALPRTSRSRAAARAAPQARRRDARASVGAPSSSATARELGGQAARSASSSAASAAVKSGSPTTSIGAAQAGCAWRSTSRGSTAPL